MTVPIVISLYVSFGRLRNFQIILVVVGCSQVVPGGSHAGIKLFVVLPSNEALPGRKAHLFFFVLPGSEALPGGNLFALLILLVLGQIAGYFVNRVLKGPELLGKYQFQYPSRLQPTGPGYLRSVFCKRSCTLQNLLL